MRILYYGQLEEIGVKLCNSLAATNELTAVSASECGFELACRQYRKADVDMDALVREFRPEAVLIYEPENCDYREIYRLLCCCEQAGTTHAAIIAQAPFYRRTPLNAEIEQMLCKEFSRREMHAFVIACSVMYGGATVPDYVAQQYALVQKKGLFIIPDRDDVFCDALHVDDLCSFLNRAVKTGFEGMDTLIQLQSGYPFLLKQFIDAFTARFPMAEAVREEGSLAEQPFVPFSDGVFAPEHSFMEDAEECFALAETAYRKTGAGKLVLPSLGRIGLLLLAFAAIELYLHFVPVASDLQFVDLRLLLIVCAGLFCGKRIGLGCALMCSVSSILHCILSDVKWYVIFFHVDNWIPIAVYFVAAILIGSYHDAVREQEKDS